MPHQSENAARLAVRTISLTKPADFPETDPRDPAVWFFVLPSPSPSPSPPPPRRQAADDWADSLRCFAGGLHEQSVVAVLTSPVDAALVAAATADALHFQLWIAVKLSQPVARTGRLPEHHAALLVLSKYRSPLRHTKTRVGYTYCPACHKTTKDYGGKKHTYHEYGTLMSDVWHDVCYTPGEPPDAVVDRLADLFGVEPYRTLNVVDLSSVASVAPRRGKRRTAWTCEAAPLASRLGCGDVLDKLGKLPSDSIDFAFADPPYNLAKRYDAWDDDIAVADYLDWCGRWLSELARMLRPGRTCAVLNIPMWAIRHVDQMRRCGLDFQCWIAWEGLSLPVRRIMPAHYAIVCFAKGQPRALPGLHVTALREDYCLRASCARRRETSDDRQPITDLWCDIHRLKHNARRVDHPCQLPPALMRRLIELFTLEGEVVLDPFDGAGTTTLCAAAMRRRYIGIDLSPRYHELARARHEVLQAGGDPFAKADRVPSAKNSRVGRAGRAGGIRYEVPKKTLQLEAKRVSQLLGHLPSRADLRARGRFPIRYYDQYFANWGEVCAAARTTGMSEHRNIDARR